MHVLSIQGGWQGRPIRCIMSSVWWCKEERFQLGSFDHWRSRGFCLEPMWSFLNEILQQLYLLCCICHNSWREHPFLYLHHLKTAAHCELWHRTFVKRVEVLLCKTCVLALFPIHPSFSLCFISSSLLVVSCSFAPSSAFPLAFFTLALLLSCWSAFYLPCCSSACFLIKIRFRTAPWKFGVSSSLVKGTVIHESCLRYIRSKTCMLLLYVQHTRWGILVWAVMVVYHLNRLRYDYMQSPALRRYTYLW